MTILITRRTIEQTIDPMAVREALVQGFIDHSLHATWGTRVRTDLPGPGTATVLWPGSVPGIPAYSVKVHAKFPGQQPALQGVLLLHDSGTGRLLAVMDSTWLTAVRTAWASVLAAQMLARPDARQVAVIGAGVQGFWQLTLLARTRPISGVAIYDPNPGNARQLAQYAKDTLHCAARITTDVTAVIADADIALVATWARQAFLLPEHLHPGLHISTLGADEPGKQEVAPEAIAEATVVAVDDRRLARQMGLLQSVDCLDASVHELGEILGRDVPVPRGPDDVTIFGAVGLPFQDVVMAWAIYQTAVAQGLGTHIDFLDSSGV